MMAGGGKSKEGGDGGASGRAPLVSGRCEEKKEEMTAGSHNQINIWVLPLADRPPLQSGPSEVLLGVTSVLHTAGTFKLWKCRSGHSLGL